MAKMTKQEVLEELKSLGSEKLIAQNKKRGAGDNQYGVKMGDVRKIATKIKKDQELGLELWETNKMEARCVAILILDPKKLSNAQLTAMVSSEKFTNVIDWLYSYLIKDSLDKQTLRLEWEKADNVMLQRLAWSLISGNIARNPELEDSPKLLDYIEKHMLEAKPEIQWTMNSTLAQIGIKQPQYRDRALAIGHKLGVYKDYPVSKGCTSPFAPIWIDYFVSREKQ